MSRFAFFWGLSYAILKYGLLDMNTLIDLLSKTEFTRKSVELVVAYPDVVVALEHYS